MRHPILITAILLAFGSLNAQTLVTQAKLGDNWGYIDIKGEFLVPPTYRTCYRFSENGLAPVIDVISKKPMFINLKGAVTDTEVKDFEFVTGFLTDAQGFKCGLAPVKVKGKWGFMDGNGRMAIAAKYDKVDPFENCLTSVLIGKSRFILTAQGTETALKDAGILDVKDFVGGLAPFRANDKRYGFMDAQQNIVIPAQFQSVGYFTTDLAWAKDAGGKVGFIDRKGNWVIQPLYEAGHEFDPVSGLAKVKSGETYFYVRKNGETLKVADSQSWGNYSEGLARGEKGARFGFYDAKGMWVVEPQFEAVRDFKNGYAAVKQGGKWGMIDMNGKMAFEPKFDGIKDMELVK